MARVPPGWIALRIIVWSALIALVVWGGRALYVRVLAWEARFDCRTTLRSEFPARIERCMTTPGCAVTARELEQLQYEQRRAAACRLKYGDEP